MGRTTVDARACWACGRDRQATTAATVTAAPAKASPPSPTALRSAAGSSTGDGPRLTTMAYAAATPTPTPTARGIESSSTALRPRPGGRHPSDRQQGDRPSSAVEPQRRGRRDQSRPGEGAEPGDRPDASADRGLDGPGALGDEGQVRVQERSTKSASFRAAVGSTEAPRSARGDQRLSARAPLERVAVARATGELVHERVGLGHREVAGRGVRPKRRRPRAGRPNEGQTAKVSAIGEEQEGWRHELAAARLDEDHVRVRAPEVVGGVPGQVPVDAGDRHVHAADVHDIAGVQPEELGRPIAHQHPGTVGALQDLHVIQRAVAYQERGALDDVGIGAAPREDAGRSGPNGSSARAGRTSGASGSSGGEVDRVAAGAGVQRDAGVAGQRSDAWRATDSVPTEDRNSGTAASEVVITAQAAATVSRTPGRRRSRRGARRQGADVSVESALRSPLAMRGGA